MARTDLSSLLDKIDTDEAVGPRQQPEGAVSNPQSDAQVEATTPRPTAVPGERSSRSRARSSKANSEDSTQPAVHGGGEPLYLRLVRKETRLREDQYETLTEYARKLNRAKASGSPERITENTLIRIAVDLLIPHLGEMTGNDESELRNSVSNRV